jgi:hypothetical protein
LAIVAGKVIAPSIVISPLVLLPISNVLALTRSISLADRNDETPPMVVAPAVFTIVTDPDPALTSADVVFNTTSSASRLMSPVPVIFMSSFIVIVWAAARIMSPVPVLVTAPSMVISPAAAIVIGPALFIPVPVPFNVKSSYELMAKLFVAPSNSIEKSPSNFNFSVSVNHAGSEPFLTCSVDEDEPNSVPPGKDSFNITLTLLPS